MSCRAVTEHSRSMPDGVELLYWERTVREISAAPVVAASEPWLMRQFKWNGTSKALHRQSGGKPNDPYVSDMLHEPYPQISTTVCGPPNESRAAMMRMSRDTVSSIVVLRSPTTAPTQCLT